MKKVVIGLLLAAIAVGGSSFTNAREKKAINENYLVQTLIGVFLRQSTATGACLNLGAGLYCIYAVNPTGKSNIPAQSWYSSDDINNFIANGWLDMVPLANQGLYLL